MDAALRSRRVLAPAALLLTAACALIAVFAVHRIEAAGGPLAEPYATRYLSPDGDGSHDAAIIRFNTRRPERLTIRVLDARGRTVRTVLRDARVDGARSLDWDATDGHGRALPDGDYRVVLTRVGDDRQYEPTQHTRIDTVDPIGRIHRIRRAGTQLRGLFFAEEGARLEVRDPTGGQVRVTTFVPAPGTPSADPAILPPPRGTRTFRFVVELEPSSEPATFRYSLVDRAGNRRQLDAPAVEIARAAQ